MNSRREVLTYALPAMALTATLAGCARAGDEPDCEVSPKGITREQYEKYVSLYNANDPAFAEFYNDDVVMETVPPLEGPQAILDFSADLRSYVSEHMTVEFFVSDETGAAAQVVGEFTCHRDMPISALGGLFGKAVKQGQVLRQRGILLYGVRDGKFSFIRAAPPMILQDWS